TSLRANPQDREWWKRAGYQQPANSVIADRRVFYGFFRRENQVQHEFACQSSRQGMVEKSRLPAAGEFGDRRPQGF
ncbi:hypothetical protein VS877_22495, partial [Salmonella enterica subsp. enterica serovar Paratyphi A]|nr:hypothetical protein [Salmonella enterica subsp. enterica serovar Paratyphi A]